MWGDVSCILVIYVSSATMWWNVLEIPAKYVGYNFMKISLAFKEIRLLLDLTAIPSDLLTLYNQSAILLCT